MHFSQINIVVSILWFYYFFLLAYGECVYTDVIPEDCDSASQVHRYIGQFYFDVVLVLTCSVFLCAVVLLSSFILVLVQQCFKSNLKVYVVPFRVLSSFICYIRW